MRRSLLPLRIVLVLLLLQSVISSYASLPQVVIGDQIGINKCCAENELFMSTSCVLVAATGETRWTPIFTTEYGGTQIEVNYKFVTGTPACGSHQQWPIYHYANSSDVLRLLPNGKLRHYIQRPLPGDEYGAEFDFNKKKLFYHDYDQGKYCLDKRIDDGKAKEYALVCGPEKETDWTATDFMMRNIINPITHLIAIACFLTIAIVYFVMPTLKDLVGNIVTTLCLCMIVSQAADLIRLLSILNNHLSLLITEAICYISLVGAFFWLNSLAYYIWKTFKSRNVYLRITDSKKFCYYSAYAWSCTLVLGGLAIFAHYTMDYDTNMRSYMSLDEQEHIGSLGVIIFFMPVAFTILIDVFLFATTLKVIGRMHTYGRIHYKLRHIFRMYLLLFLIMSLTWIFFLMSFSKFDGLVYAYIIVNAFQAPVILYICLINQRHVAFLLRKTCCYTNCVCVCCRPEPEMEWGDEMTAMNNGIY